MFSLLADQLRTTRAIQSLIHSPAFSRSHFEVSSLSSPSMCEPAVKLRVPCRRLDSRRNKDSLKLASSNEREQTGLRSASRADGCSRQRRETQPPPPAQDSAESLKDSTPEIALETNFSAGGKGLVNEPAELSSQPIHPPSASADPTSVRRRRRRKSPLFKPSIEETRSRQTLTLDAEYTKSVMGWTSSYY